MSTTPQMIPAGASKLLGVRTMTGYCARGSSICLFSVVSALAVALSCLHAPQRPLTSAGPCAGWLSGTVASVKTNRRHEVAAEVPHARLLLQFKTTEVLVVSDERGDYYGTPLECGDYRLQRVTDHDGSRLRTAWGQPTRFSVRSDQNTRFDVTVVRTKYQTAGRLDTRVAPTSPGPDGEPPYAPQMHPKHGRPGTRPPGLSCICLCILVLVSAPGRTRTCDPRLRRPVLYPPELRARAG